MLKNEERKEVVQKIFDEAMTMVDLDKPVQVLCQEGWHPGRTRYCGGAYHGQIRQ